MTVEPAVDAVPIGSAISLTSGNPGQGRPGHSGAGAPTCRSTRLGLVTAAPPDAEPEGEPGGVLQLLTLPVAHGVLAEVPLWSDRPDSTNWAATITGLSRGASGGYTREFWFTTFTAPTPEKPACGYYFIPYYLGSGHPVVFAGDEVDHVGNRHCRRWYGLVTAVTDCAVTLAQYSSASAAVHAAQDFPARPAVRDHHELVDVRNAVLDALVTRDYPITPLRLVAALREVVRATETMTFEARAELLSRIDQELHRRSC
jgi:hypothetical protein